MRTERNDIVWDLPTRLFHWTLVALIALQFASGEFELMPMSWHYRLGEATLALVLFRIVWGFVGSTTSRFASFVRGPVAVARYLIALARGRAGEYAGHNPLGGWSVLAMLAAVLVQAGSGLFASDDILEQGPLVGRVSEATVDLMTRIHAIDRWLLVLLIALHVVAVVGHRIMRGDDLIAPMWHGRKPGVDAGNRIASGRLALAILGVCAGAVWALVAWGARA